MSRWPEAQLRRLFRLVNGGTPTSEEANWDGEVRWATPVDLARVDGAIIDETQRRLTDVGLRSGSRSVPRGSLIISTRAPIGYVAETNHEMAFNQGCRGLVSKRSMDLRYFRYQLSALGDELRSRGAGSTFQELSTDALASLPVTNPDLGAQRAIADFLDSETARIDALIEKKRQLAAKLRERRLATTLRGVSGCSLPARMVTSDLHWMSHKPEHWEEPLLRLVARLGSGHTPSRSRPEWWMDCTIPWITTGEVTQMREDRVEYVTETREKISEIGMRNSSAELHPAGTVVLSRTASAGFSAIMGKHMATSQDFVTWTCGPLLDPRYLLLCLRTMRPDLLGRLAQGSTHKTIYMPDIETIRIPLPPREEQRQIVETVWRTLQRIDKTTNLLNQQIELLTEHRQALITAAVTGEIEVPGASAA